MAKSELILALEQIEREKGIKVDEILKMIEGAVVSSLRKHVGEETRIEASIDPDTSTTSTTRQSSERLKRLWKYKDWGARRQPWGVFRAVLRLRLTVRARSRGPEGRRTGRGLLSPLKAGRTVWDSCSTRAWMIRSTSARKRSNC